MDRWVRYEGWIFTGFTVSYLIVFNFLLGLKAEHVILTVLCVVLYFAHPNTRKFILAYFIFWLYWIIWDGMKAFPNYQYGSVALESLYLIDKSIFNLNYKGSVLSFNEYFLQNPSNLLTSLSGFFYINWIPLPIIFGFYLFVYKPGEFLRFALCFFLANVIGFIIYYTYPAAPPWYVHLNGYEFIPETKGNAAGLLEFDKYYGTTVFEDMYSKSSNVFAAFPSLHAAYPLIVLFYGIKSKLRYWNVLFLIFVVGIWWAAVYTQHHYAIDLVAGAVCAVLGWIGIEKILPKFQTWNSFMAAYESRIRL